MIVITTPTGLIGHQVLDRVLEADEPVRVIVRDPSRLSPQVLDRVEVIEGSHGQAEVVDRAFAGADAVFWLAPPNPTFCAWPGLKKALRISLNDWPPAAPPPQMTTRWAEIAQPLTGSMPTRKPPILG